MRFLLIDRIDEIRPGEFARGVKNVTMSEDFMQDHFPGFPVFPGTLIIEAMAQLGGYLAESACNEGAEEPRRAMLAQIDRAKFYEPCRPADQIELHCTLESALKGAAQIKGEAFVREKRVACAGLTYVLRTLDGEKVHEQRDELYKIWTERLRTETKSQ